MKSVIFISFLSFIMIGCTAQGSFIRTDTIIYPSKSYDFELLILTSKPQRPYKEIGIVTVHKQATTVYGEINGDELMPELINNGRAIGADALIDLKFENYSKSAIFSAREKHALKATATAIIFLK